MHYSAYRHPDGGLHFPNWDLLVVATRDPVSRTVSAFNFELGEPYERMAPLKA